MLAQQFKTITDGTYLPGMHTVVWDGPANSVSNNVDEVQITE